MCQTTENVSLYYFSGTNPREYELGLHTGGTQPILRVPENQINYQMGNTNSTITEYHVDVQMDAIPQNHLEIRFPIHGQPTIPSSNVCFHLNITDANGNSIFHGHIRVEEGEQESRPIKKL